MLNPSSRGDQANTLIVSHAGVPIVARQMALQQIWNESGIARSKEGSPMELNWSRWFYCESSFGLLLVPDQPGIFALAEEVAQPTAPGSRRMLAVFEISEADNVARALSRMFASGSPWHERLTGSRCYLRYTVVTDPEKRQLAAAALKNWLDSQMDNAAEVFEQRVPIRTSGPQEACTVAERAVDRVMAKPHFPNGF